MKIISKLVLLAITPYLALAPAIVKAEDNISSTRKEEIRQKVDSIKSKSKERIEELKKKASEKTVEVRTKACEARESNIENRLKNRVEAAKRHQEKFSSIYDKVNSFAQEKSLSSADITTLQNKVLTDKTKINAEIATLEALNVNLDCSNPDGVAEVIDTYKNQLDSVKSSLKNYRESIRLYSQAVKKLAEEGEGA